jgi:tetratricopeptide (TPR) repeat protein
MPIWSAEIKELESVFISIKGRFPDLEKDLGNLIKTDDENVALLYSRRCLEIIITDLCESELKRPRKTEPLKGIIDKLHKEEKVPAHIITSMESLNSLSTYGTHPKEFDPEQVKPVLNNLTIIIKWYLKYKDTQAINKHKVEVINPVSDVKIPPVQTEIGRKPKLALIIVPAVILLIIAVFVCLKIFKQDRLEQLMPSDKRISVAVMPFQNMTNDTIWNIWQDGIKDNIITYLSNFSEDLAVRQKESINGVLQNQGLTNYASLSPSIARAISQKLNADILISGSINQAGSIIRVNAQLINSKTEELFKSFQLEGRSEEEIFHIIDSLSSLIKDFLIISVMEKEIVPEFRQLISTSSSEAYRDYMYANQALYKLDYSTATEWFLKAIDIDTNFTEAIRMLTYSYNNAGFKDEAKKWCKNLHQKMDQMSMIEKLYANAVYAMLFETPYESIKYWKLIQEYDDQMPVPYGNIGGWYLVLHQYDKAISEYEKQLEIYEKWESRPRWSLCYTDLGELYHLTGQYKKEMKLYRKAEKDFPDDIGVIYRQAVLSLTTGDTEMANQYIDQFISASRINSDSKATIATGLASMYQESGIPDKAEEYFRQALSLEPESPERINALAWFLIDTDRNVDEGIELINKVLELSPEDYLAMDTKGWGLYKQGKYKEALEVLEKSWDLKPVYNHEIYLHIEEVKKAIAGQNNK